MLLVATWNSIATKSVTFSPCTCKWAALDLILDFSILNSAVSVKKVGKENK